MLGEGPKISMKLPSSVIKAPRKILRLGVNNPSIFANVTGKYQFMKLSIDEF
jgi:hypothetical protein